MENEENPTSTGTKVQFRRRLNRDPDKSFDKLRGDGKIMVNSFRTALEEAKLRILRLRDENDKKDDVIEEERTYRMALEEKMEKYLVDLYNNPDVNAELHQRLPRAKKKGHIFQGAQAEYDSEHDAGSESSDVVTNNPEGHNQKELSEHGRLTRMQPIVNGHLYHQGNQPTGDNLTDVVTVSMATQQNAEVKTSQHPVPNSNQHSTQSPSPGPFYSGVPPAPGYPHPASGYPHPAPGHPQYPYHTTLLHYNRPTPISSASLTSFASSSYQGLPSMANQEVIHEASQQKLNPAPIPNTTLNQDEDTARPRDVHGTQIQTHASKEKFIPNHQHVSIPGMNINAHEQSTVPQMNLNPIPPYLIGSGFINPHDRSENVSQITRLLQETSVLKRENKELKRELKEQKKDLELLKMDTTQEDEIKNTEAIAALIEEVKRAEKAGEKAVSQLIQSANEDRNVALQELDRLRLKAAKRNIPLSSVSQTDVSCQDDTEESEIGDSSFSSDHEFMGSEISSIRIKKLLERQKEITKQQVEGVIAERDEALEKVNRLRKKLSSIRLSEFPGATNQTLQAKLKITEKERDIAVGKLKLMSQDMNEVILLYNLQKALLKDDVNIDSKNSPTSKWTSKTTTSKNNKTMVISESDEKEKTMLEEKLKSLERDNVEKEKRIEKLEELVLRQRKKLNALCAGPLLMND